MPSPPITIGELTDVPAFDSPIASPWAQEVTRRCAHRFATTAERDAKYPPATAGAGAICAVAGELYRSTGARWIGSGFAGVLGNPALPYSLGSAAWQAVPWNPVGLGDPFGMISAGDKRNITIPYTGRWSVTFSIDSSPAPTSSAPGLMSNLQGIWAMPTVNGTASWGGSWVMWLSAGEVIKTAIYNGGAVLNIVGGGLHILSLGGV